MCYYLAKNTDVYEKLKFEIRNNFSSREEMTLAKLANLEYLNRVIREGLRMFPPAADIFPRIIPEGGEVIMGKFLPEGVSQNDTFQTGVWSWPITDTCQHFSSCNILLGQELSRPLQVWSWEVDRPKSGQW